jgi:hypothetical protein
MCSNTTYNQNINELSTPSTHDLEPTQIYDDHNLAWFNFFFKLFQFHNAKHGSKRIIETRFLKILPNPRLDFMH